MSHLATKVDLIRHIEMKMWHIYTVKYFSAVKKNEIVEFAGKWMELANILMYPRPMKTNATYSPP